MSSSSKGLASFSRKAWPHRPYLLKDHPAGVRLEVYIPLPLLKDLAALDEFMLEVGGWARDQLRPDNTTPAYIPDKIIEQELTSND